MVQIVEESIYRYLEVFINAGTLLYLVLPISMPTYASGLPANRIRLQCFKAAGFTNANPMHMQQHVLL